MYIIYYYQCYVPVPSPRQHFLLFLDPRKLKNGKRGNTNYQLMLRLSTLDSVTRKLDFYYFTFYFALDLQRYHVGSKKREVD